MERLDGLVRHADHGRARRWGVAALYLSLGLVLGGAVARAGASLNLPGPVIGATRAAGPPSARRGRVLLVVVDGLRADVARSLPFIAGLGQTGARARLRADPPTYSTAQYVALLAGVPPRDSGVRTNQTIRAAGVDDVARRARDAEARTAVLSTHVDWWGRLFPRSFDDARVVPAARLLAEVERLAPSLSFLVVHLGDVDEAGHRFGAASAQYARAARDADSMTAALARAWGWPRADVAVTADHGHRDRGGHGGEEPEVSASFLVASGPDVAPGEHAAEARTVDVPPTLAAWIGVAPPAQASGRTLVDLVRVSPETRAEMVAADERRVAEVAAASAEARRAAQRAQARARLLRGVPALALVALVVWLARRRPRAFVRGLMGLAVTIALFTGIFGPISFSAARRAIVWGAALATLAFITAALATLAGARRREGWLGIAAVVAGFAPPAIAAFVHSGLYARRLDCEPAWVAAGPAFAYAALAAACLAALLITIWPRLSPAGQSPPP